MAELAGRCTPLVDLFGSEPVERLRETGGNERIHALAADLGCSRRYLTRRFSAEVGLPPKPYGSREYSARDLEGHAWSFATYNPDA